MDASDDLLRNASDSEPEEDETSDPEDASLENASSEDASSEGTSSASETSALESGDDSWNDLLDGLSYDEEEEAPDLEPSNEEGRRLSIVQMIILGVLGIFVVAVWGVVGLMIIRSIPAETPEGADSETVVTVVSYTDGTPANAITPTIARTPAAESEGATAGPPPTATFTPTPSPPVSTVYDNQIANNPEDIDPYLLRGREYLSLGLYKLALEDFLKAKSLDKERADVYVGIGWAQYYLARWDDAEASFGTAVAFNQDLSDAHFGLGKLFYYQGRYEESAAEFDWAAEIDRQDAEAEAWLAIAAARQGDPTEAMGAATRALSITDEMPLVYVARSWAYRTQDPPDLERAHGDLIYARNLAPNDFHTLNALAHFYLTLRPERLVEAEQLASYARNWAQTPIQEAVALQTLGRIYLDQDRVDEAREALNASADLVTSGGEIVLVDLVDDLERARRDS